jgi:hypothetical protein
MIALPLRLSPGSDLRRSLEESVAVHGSHAAFVISGIGSLSRASLRLAGKPDATAFAADLEILTIAGTISPDGAHLHMSVADADGRVTGGHLGYGCTVRTTAEVLVVLLPEWSFTREADGATGYPELVVRHAAET